MYGIKSTSYGPVQWEFRILFDNYDCSLCFAKFLRRLL
jgi:hypothetical protein